MKILCPEHNGMIEVPSEDFATAFNSPSRSLVLTCPVCEEEILVQNIQPEEHDMSLRIEANNSSTSQKKPKGI